MAWVTPTDVDPGDAILASLYNQDVVANTNYLKAEADAVGLQFITNISGTATAVSVNNCFSAEYNHYCIVAKIAESQNMSVRLRWRVANADADGANTYYFVNPISDTSPNSFTEFTRNAPGPSYVVATVWDPFIATPTRLRVIGQSGTTSASGQNVICFHNVSTSYTGFTIFADTGGATVTVTGSVFGYRNI